MVDVARSIGIDEFNELFQQLKNWGRWGKDDEMGALNLISREKCQRAGRLIMDGVSVSCALPLALRPAPFNSSPGSHYMSRAGDLVSDQGYGVTLDYFAMAAHGMSDTHLDALCHIFYDGRMYNGRAASEVTSAGAQANTIESVQEGVATRAVLLDIPRTMGRSWLEPGEAVYIEDLIKAEEEQGLRVEEGDILLIYTGRHRRARQSGPWNPRESLAGLHGTAMAWLHERGVAVLGCDGISDVIPSGLEGVASPTAGRPVHLLALPSMGVHLIDNCDLENVAAACVERMRWEFFMMLAPLKLSGGTGCPVNPIAVF